jgi:hypothetical protein
VGSAAFALLRHCATRGALHDTSQRLPLFSVLHEVVELFVDVEWVVDAVPPVFVELVTLDEFVAFTEFVTVAAFRESTVVFASLESTFSAEPHADSASTKTAMRYFMFTPPLPMPPSGAPSMPVLYTAFFSRSALIPAAS